MFGLRRSSGGRVATELDVHRIHPMARPSAASVILLGRRRLASCRARRPAALYIMYGSIFSPLGQRQVLPYVLGLAGVHVEMAILTFEPSRPDVAVSSSVRAEISARLVGAGVTWIACTYHPGSSLLMKAWDLLMGLAKALSLSIGHRIGIVHARSDLPALLGLILKYTLGCRLLFDVRGLLADEYLDAGHWRA